MEKKAFIYADEKEVYVNGTQAHYALFLENIAFSCTRGMLHHLPLMTIKEIIMKAVEKGIKEGKDAFLKGDWS